MEDNKYYIPEINEFHVGFEFEYFCEERQLCAKEHAKITSCWEKDEFTWEWVDRIYDDWRSDYENFKDWYRVKYLDREDVEGLGWMLDSSYSAKLGNWILEANLANTQKDTIEIYLVSDLRFRGTIKNKSELVRIMKQIGII